VKSSGVLGLLLPLAIRSWLLKEIRTCNYGGPPRQRGASQNPPSPPRPFRYFFPANITPICGCTSVALASRNFGQGSCYARVPRLVRRIGLLISGVADRYRLGFISGYHILAAHCFLRIVLARSSCCRWSRSPFSSGFLGSLYLRRLAFGFHSGVLFLSRG